MYKYKPKDYLPNVGDICEHEDNGLFIVDHIFTSVGRRCIGYKPHYSYPQSECKTLDTKPGTEAVVGDTVIIVDNMGTTSNIGTVTTVTTVHKNGNIRVSAGSTGLSTDFVVLQLAEPELLHQEWKALYTKGVELEWRNHGVWGKDDGHNWNQLVDAVPGDLSLRFSSPRYEYRKKEQTAVAKPEFKYPIYKKHIGSGLVRKFTALSEGVNVAEGYYDNFSTKVGYVSTASIEHTNSIWEPWDPQFDYDTVMQPNVVVHCTTESETNELLYWAHKHGLKWPNKDSLIEHNRFKEYDKGTICYIFKPAECKAQYGILRYFEKKGYTILTMDEARNGKQLPNIIYDDPIKEQTMDKPLLSDLLKQHGAYEKFLANLSISFSTYSAFIHNTSTQHCIYYAFTFGESNEGGHYWYTIADQLPECSNDVRAPDDIEYWDEQFNEGKEVFVYKPSTEYMYKCNFPPNEWEPETQFYAELPTWLEQGIPTTKEQTMEVDKPTKFKIGDSICIAQDATHYLVIGIADNYYLHPDNLRTSFKSANLLYKLVTSAPTTTVPSNDEPTTHKENTMTQSNQELAEAIAMGIAAANCKPTKCKAPKTELQARLPITAVFYDTRTGDYDCTRYFKSVKKADKFLQSTENPHLTTMIIHKEQEVVTTKLPLSRTKSK